MQQPAALSTSPALVPRRAALRLWAIATAAALGYAMFFSWMPGMAMLEERLRDALTATVRIETPVAGVLVVDISEESLKAVGVWPWSRARLADLVEELLTLGASGVALDLVLPEPGDAAGDARLASLAAHAPLVLAHVLDFAQRASPITVGTLGGPPQAPGDGPEAQQAQGFVANHAGLQGARCVGHIGAGPDPDGVLRRIHLRAEVASRIYPALALALVQCADPAAAAAALARFDAGTQAWRIPYRRSIAAFSTAPAESVLRGQLDASQVKGRLVLIGSSAVGLSDYVATPLQPVTAGVLVHAQALGELLEPGPARSASASPWRDMAISAAAWTLAVVLLATASSRSIAQGMAALGLFTVAWLGFCAYLFRQGAGPVVLPPLAGAIGFALAWLGVDFARARRETRRMMNTLAHYVAAPVLKLLVKEGLERSLTPSRRDITVLVADMAGYTRMTAESPLEDSARLTTDFLEAITHPVLDSGGTLDRYTGDGLIAFWGAPLERPDHADCAYQAATQMQAALGALNAVRRGQGRPPLAMRIGIESGEALVGDLGSSARSVYTAVGTCINLASRLQEVARDIGQPLVIGPQAKARIGRALRPLGTITVRGLAEPIEVFGAPLTLPEL